MEFGLQVNALELPRLRDVAQQAEGLGFGFLALPDHYLYEGPEHQHDPSALVWDPMLAAAVLASATTRARIGHLVLCNLFRHPVETARALTTLDHLSGGRVVAGIGAGWTEREFEMTGIPFPDVTTRLRMLDESLAVMRRLWTEETTTHQGEFYRLGGAIAHPKPVQHPHPPILLGGAGKGLLRIAARHADIVNVIAETGRKGYIALDQVAKFTDARFRARVAFVRDEARAAGRDPETITLSNVCFTAMVTDSPDETRERAIMFSGLFGGSIEATLRSPTMLLGTPEEIVAEIRRRRTEWGIAQLVISFAGEAMLQRFGEEVVPRV
ncbi:MAG: TIGR03619 family F420-dependent LLM class oxidoreductase [bacterium]|nr:TIGR03619 family F420-dependent LLM class oxidoreductase [bacterium]